MSMKLADAHAGMDGRSLAVVCDVPGFQLTQCDCPGATFVSA
jgi:hypothetical protein